MASLIGSIQERKPASKVSAPSSPNTGFPAVQHRSQSVFARGRGTSQKRAREVPAVQASRFRSQLSSFTITPMNSGPEDWRAQTEEENRHRVESMTEEEREQEKAEILERFGPNVADVLRKAREAREAQQRRGESGQANTSLGFSPQATGEDEVMSERSSSPPPDSRILRGERTRSFSMYISSCATKNIM